MNMLGLSGTAVFIDAENVKGANLAAWLPRLLGHVEGLGHVGAPDVVRAYAGWAKTDLARMKENLAGHGVETIDVASANTKTPNAADIHLAVDVVAESFVREHLAVVILISGDGGLVPLVEHLRERSITVIGAGLANTASTRLLKTCSHYVLFQAARPSRPLDVSPLSASEPTDSRTFIVRQVEVLLAEARPLPVPVLAQALQAESDRWLDDGDRVGSRFIDEIAEVLAGSGHVVFQLEPGGMYFVDERSWLPADALLMRSVGWREPVFLSGEGNALREADGERVDVVGATRIVLMADDLMIRNTN
jgi:uncharacterized LabA/DUF88 family protein